MMDIVAHFAYNILLSHFSANLFLIISICFGASAYFVMVYFMITAALPVIELRGAIPVDISLGLSHINSYLSHLSKVRIFNIGRYFAI